MIKEKRNIGIDILRIICATMVVFIHLKNNDLISNYISDIFRIAVPIFFIISGYYFKNLYSNGKVKKHIINLIKTLIVVNVFYFVYYLLRHYLNGDIVDWFIYLKDSYSLVDILLFNANPLLHRLWYINAIIYVMLIALFVEKHNLSKYMKIISIFLLIICINIGSYSLLTIGKGFKEIYCRNFLFLGLPCFYIGFFLNENKNDKHNYCLISVILLIVNIVEIYLLRKFNLYSGREMFLTTPFLAISVFEMFSKIKFSRKLSLIIAEVGKKHSANIYYYHKFIEDIVRIIVGKISLLKNFELILITIGCICFSIIINLIKNKIYERKV